MIDGQNKQKVQLVTSCAFHSFLVEVQTKLATCLSCLRDSNLDNRIAGSSCRPQRFLSIVFVFMLLVQVAKQKNFLCKENKLSAYAYFPGH